MMEALAAPSNYPSEADDYDGQDLRTIFQEGNFDRPRWWHESDDEPNATFHPQTTATSDEMSPGDWVAVRDYGIRVIHMNRHRYMSSWLAPYLHFDSVNEFNYYVDTIGMVTFLTPLPFDQ
jgi:hypothetical protein